MLYSAYFLAAAITFGLFSSSDNKEDITTITEKIEIANRYVYSNPAKTIELINEVSPSLKEFPNNDITIRAKLIKGRSHLNLGQYESAFETLITAYEDCPKDQKRQKMQLAVYLSDTYRSLRIENKAYSYVQEAISLANSMKDSSILALSYNVLGLIYISQNKNNKAEESFKKSLTLNRRLNNLKSIAANLNNLCLYPNNNPLEKVKLLEEAIAINQKLNAQWSISENYNNMATQFFYANNYPKALECLNKAFAIAEQLKAKELICDNYRYKSWVYEAMGNYNLAFKFLKLLYDTETEMLSDKRISKIEGERADRQMAKKQEEMLLNKKEFEIKSLKKERIIFLLGSVSILLVVGSIFLRYRHTKRLENLLTQKRLAEKERELTSLRLVQTETERNSIQQELHHSKNDLTNFACYIKSKNEFLDNLKEEIKRGYNLSDENLKSHLKNLRNTIVQYQNSSNEQNILIGEIESVNEEFLDRLSQRHPDLTKNEKNLASLLRIDLSTKDISNIIGSTPKTVNMARYRLRKKLKLESDEQLAEYIKKI